MYRPIAMACSITAAMSFFTPHASAQTSTNVVDSKSDWSVFVENEPRRCWIVSKPTKTINMKAGKPVVVNRSDIRFFITYLPKNGVRGEVSFTGGYPFNPDSTVSLSIGSAKYELYVDGEFRGAANQTIELMAASQQIEIRKAGFIPYSTEFTSRPGLEQVINVSLKSLEQARLEQIKPVIVSAAGQTLKLFYPGAFTMGASRREAGRRPNENLRDIKLERPFYLSNREVTNAEFRLFNEEHSSGTLEGLTLDNQAQPVVRITWTQAALFCNWLSDQESLPRFYEVAGEDVVGFNAEATGYRLPSEAEWSWAARTDGSGNQLKYSWGEMLPPPENSGNFADVTAQSYLGQIMFNYNDGYLATAPVATFEANQYELYDMSGNVSELSLIHISEPTRPY